MENEIFGTENAMAETVSEGIANACETPSFANSNLVYGVGGLMIGLLAKPALKLVKKGLTKVKQTMDARKDEKTIDITPKKESQNNSEK